MQITHWVYLTLKIQIQLKKLLDIIQICNKELIKIFMRSTLQEMRLHISTAL